MSKRFDSGYALLIGVNENAVTRWSLPEVVKDIDALRSVLIHPERCAYPVDHLDVLTGKQATRDNILDGLARLRDKVAADKSANATAVIYYSGHGWRDAEQAPPDYYLIPCNVSEHQLRSRALRASDFAAGINELEARRLLVILDCCHAGGMGVKGVSPEGYCIGGRSAAAVHGQREGGCGCRWIKGARGSGNRQRARRHQFFSSPPDVIHAPRREDEHFHLSSDRGSHRSCKIR